MIHSNAYVGSTFAITAALFEVPYLGNIIFLGGGYYMIKFLVFKPFKFFLSFLGVFIAYNGIIHYGPTGMGS